MLLNMRRHVSAAQAQVPRPHGLAGVLRSAESQQRPSRLRWQVATDHVATKQAPQVGRLCLTQQRLDPEFVARTARICVPTSRADSRAQHKHFRIDIHNIQHPRCRPLQVVRAASSMQASNHSVSWHCTCRVCFQPWRHGAPTLSQSQCSQTTAACLHLPRCVQQV